MPVSLRSELMATFHVTFLAVMTWALSAFSQSSDTSDLGIILKYNLVVAVAVCVFGCVCVGGGDAKLSVVFVWKRCRTGTKRRKVSSCLEQRGATKSPLASFLIKNLAWVSPPPPTPPCGLGSSLQAYKLKVPLLIFKYFPLYSPLGRMPAVHCLNCRACLKYGNRKAALVFVWVLAVKFWNKNP